MCIEHTTKWLGPMNVYKVPSLSLSRTSFLLLFRVLDLFLLSRPMLLSFWSQIFSHILSQRIFDLGFSLVAVWLQRKAINYWADSGTKKNYWLHRRQKSFCSGNFHWFQENFRHYLGEMIKILKAYGIPDIIVHVIEDIYQGIKSESYYIRWWHK